MFKKKKLFLQRTVEDISTSFIPLEEAIRVSLIPALVGRNVTDLERSMIALPLRFGGLGIQDPVKISDKEYKASKSITEELTNMIVDQNKDLSMLNLENIKHQKQLVRKDKELYFKLEVKRIKEALDGTKCRAFEEAAMKGASSWLSAMPLSSLGYCLSKRDFRDSICLRYDWRISDMPLYCGCGNANNVDHALTCKLGGYVHLRHDTLVDTESKLLIEAKCKNVQTEPHLLSTSPELHPPGTITADGARLDIEAVGLYKKCERTLFDVRITHANAPSNQSVSLEKLFARHEKEKKDKYLSRVINTEKSSFVPLVFSTSGGMAPECERFHKKVAEKISYYRRERYSDVISFIRTRVRFSLLKAVLVSIHGIRGKHRNVTPTSSPLSYIDFGLIPKEREYECR